MPNDPLSAFLTDTMARCDAATAGPWILDGWQIWHDLGEHYPGFTGVEASKNCLTGKSRANLTFAVSARTDLPTALKIIAELAKALAFYADDANHESREYIIEASRPEDERYDPCDEEHYDSTPYFEDGGESAKAALARANDIARGKQ